MSPQLALLVNPAARGGRTLRLLEPVARRLRAGGAELSVIVGDDAADALARACTAVAERPDALVAFGGDGLVHLAVQAVAGTDVPLGIIPAAPATTSRPRSGCRAPTPSRRPAPCCA